MEQHHNATGQTPHRLPGLRLGALAVALIVAFGVAPSVIPQAAQAQADDTVSLNFKDADIDTVIGAFGHLLNRTFIIDPRVRGKITVATPQPVSKSDAYSLLLGSLRLQGFTIVSSGRLGKVVPEADAKLQSGPVTAGRQPPTGGDQIVTQIFRLNYESATNMVPVLRPLIAPNNTISAYPNNNTLVITDYAANLQRISRILATLDSPSTAQVEVLPVRYGIASDLAVMLSRLLDDTQRAGQGAQVDPGQRAIVLADPSSNTIMLRASSPAKVSLAKQLLQQLDVPTQNPGNIRVVYLRNAQATKLAQTLQAVLSGDSGSGGAGALVQRTQRATSALSAGNQNSLAGGANANSAAMGSLNSGESESPITVSAGGAVIAADPTTNSLIITAPDAVYRNLRAVIDKLDMRRAQVYIESLIVEVTAEKAAEFGIQWQLLDIQNGSTRGIGGTNFSNLSGGGSILAASQNIAAAGAGLNLGVVRGTTTIPGIDGAVLNLPLLARALESDTNANVLATPNLLTMDNEEARIIIGQNVPFVTGQFTATGTGGASVNPFQTIERKDVGTTLRVRPQVSESGTVKLEIFQEVSSVQATTTASDIITNRRAIETNVLVDDGQIVVLGGLIEERVEGGEDKVPILGSIPFIGNLFRYDSRRRTKTNLLVFLRPVIVRDADAAYNITSNRYDYMSDIRNASKLREHWALPDMKPSAMVPFPAKPQMEIVPAAKSPTAGDTGDSRPAPQELRPVQPGYQRNPPSLTPGVERTVDLRPSASTQPSPAPVQSPMQAAPAQSPAAVPLAPREVRIELPPRGRSSLEVSPREAYGMTPAPVAPRAAPARTPVPEPVPLVSPGTYVN